LPRNRQHYRLTLGDALSAHEEALKYGGRTGIHDYGLIESALARPYSGYYRTISRKAAALVESFASNHGFLDGNKRTTLILLNLLLAKSGYKVALDSASKNAEVEDIIMMVVKHQIRFDDLVTWIERRLTKNP